MPHEESDLWDDDDKEVSKVPYHEESSLWDDHLSMKDDESESKITLEQPVESHENLQISEESDEESGEFDDNDESDEESGEFDDDDNEDNEVDLTYSLSIDAEDFCGTTLDDTIRDKTHSPNTEWPNNIYRKFMEIVMEYQLSNSCGDRIIKLINKSRQEAEKNPLPINTKKDRRFLDVNEFSYIKLKKVFITKFQDKDYSFYYQLIIYGIKVLLLQSEMNKEFVFKYKNHNTLIKTYGEQFKSNWWYITENKIPVDNKLLLIIIYADSTTCDHLGKTSEHSIYISLRNIPNWQQNKPNAKVLVGYLPKLKAKDNTTRNSESFRRLQRLVFQRCL
ncbi:hypothetical protein GLOIN_2v1487254 [Rhizophagus clarus]|uniref:Uncharacterized protein n=1 Tax=Rhizophagus clarus TaxID=94130 RepID=A0A8H3LVJ5_9GLOM|nr:hypothetical protein GLOIN_2v1487254 [Rhizophagus clarus]